MIDFRYHLVSIVAVFLALAIGIVVGSQALAPGVANRLNKVSRSEARQNHSLYQHNAQLKRQISADEAFARAGEARLLGGLLTGERVVLVLAPGADGSTVSGITTALDDAGATVTGQVILSARFFDTSVVTEQQLQSTADSLGQLGVPLPNSASDPQIAAQQTAARFIAAAIVTKDGPSTTQQPVTPQQSQQILTGFGQAGFLQIRGVNGGTFLPGLATMAVVVVPGTVQPPKTAGPFNLALVSLAEDLQEAGKGAVLAGNLKGSGPRSAINAVTSGAAGIRLTTVDNADTAAGQIIVAQALQELLQPSPTPTAYGVRPHRVPSPAPSPSPSASPSATRSPSPHPSARKSRR